MARKFKWNMDEFRRIRNAPGWHAYLDVMGTDWTQRLNSELHAAQAKRKQKVEDGYGMEITSTRSATRLHIAATTARGQVHEDEHSSILKLMHVVPRESVHLAEEYARRANEARNA